MRARVDDNDSDNDGDNEQSAYIRSVPYLLQEDLVRRLKCRSMERRRFRSDRDVSLQKIIVTIIVLAL